jgi:hypothetical protein
MRRRTLAMHLTHNLGLEMISRRQSELLASVLRWTPWVPLQGCWRGSTIPVLPGLYRIRRVAWDGLDYVGQTGRALRRRLGMLAGVYSREMPYRDPHTAGPALSLWALRQASGCDFEVSVCPIEGPDPWRKGWESVAIALYRQQHGQSPTVNFGRMPVGYRMSSANNARLVAAGQRFRGGPSEHPEASHRQGVAPMGPLTSDPQAPDWGGHSWSDWLPLPGGLGALPPRELGCTESVAALGRACCTSAKAWSVVGSASTSPRSGEPPIPRARFSRSRKCSVPPGC